MLIAFCLHFKLPSRQRSLDPRADCLRCFRSLIVLFVDPALWRRSVITGSQARCDLGPKLFTTRLFARTTLHENGEDCDDPSQGDEQPNPLPNGSQMFCDPRFRGNVSSLGKFGGASRNETAFPALEPSNRNPEFTADCVRRFALQQTQDCIGLLITRDTDVRMVVGSRGHFGLLVRLHL